MSPREYDRWRVWARAHDAQQLRAVDAQRREVTMDALSPETAASAAGWALLINATIGPVQRMRVYRRTK